MQRRAGQAVAVALQLAGVESDAQLGCEAGRAAMSDERAFDLDGAGYAVGGRLEGDREAIPGMVELPAMVALEGRPQRRVVPTPKVTPGGITDDPDELRGADDVGEHDRSVDARPDRRDRLG